MRDAAGVHNMLRVTTAALGATCAMGLAACGGGGASNPPPPPAPTYTVGATVSGLSGSGLALSNNGVDTLSVGANGTVTFAKSIATGSGYSISVSTQPSSPSQTCTVSNGSGAIGSANVTNVSVACTTNSYPVQPMITGLSGSGLVLQNNFADDLTVTQSGAATFASTVQSGGAYNVSVASQPSDPVQTCTIANGSGTVTNAAAAPTINCVTQVPWTLLTVNYSDNSLSLFALDPATGQPRSRGAVSVSAWPTGGSPMDVTGDGQGRFIYVLNSGAASIASFRIDPASGAIRPISNGIASTGTVPTSLRGYPSSKWLYAVNSGSNDISAYAIDQTTGILSPVSGSPFKAGIAPFKLTLDAAGAFAYVTNSASNDVYSYSIDAKTGALSEIANSRVSTGTFPFEVLLHRSGRFAYVANVGSANISAYAVEAGTGKLSSLAGSPFATSGIPGDVTSFNGGRAPMSLHPNGKLLFVRSTLAKTISVFTIDPHSGALTAASGSPYPVGDGAVMHSLDPTGRWLFVANRGTVQGPGSISVFKVNTNSGALTEVTGSPFVLSGGPAWISVDPSGKYLYACSSATDLVYGFNIDQTTGVLTALSRGSAVLTGDYPVVVLTIPSAEKPGARATFKSKYVYVPSSDNSLYGYAIDPETGKLTAVPGSPVASFGTGLAAAAATPDGRRVYTVNTGSNYLAPYDIDPTTGKLTLGPSMVGTNTGPSLLAFDAAGQNGYVLSPGASTLIAYPVDSTTGMFNSGGGVSFPAGAAPVAVAVAETGRFVFGIRDSMVETYQSHLGTVATAVLNPPGVSAAADALAVHPSGRFVYVANADASGTIQTFSVATAGLQAGSLTVGGSTQTGSMPTSVAIDPAGRFLYTANGGSNDISGFSVDEVTGALTPLGSATVATGHHPVSATVDYSGRFLFVVSDTDSSVLTYSIDQTSGALAPVGPATITGPMPKGLALSSTVETH